MFNEPIIAATILLILVGIGEVVSIYTKARVSMLLVVIIGYMLSIWTGIIPKSLIVDSKWIAVGTILGTAPIIIHMGTLIPIDQLKTQWKTCLIALSGIFCGSFTILIIVGLFINFKVAIAGAGPLSGGLIAFLVTSEGLRDAGLSSMIIIPALILSFQTLIGMPLGNYFLSNYVIHNKNRFKNITRKGSQNKISTNLIIPEKYQTDLILLFLVFIGASVSIIVENYTYLPYSLIALSIGIIGKKYRIYPEGVLLKSNAYSISMVGLIFSIIASLNDIKIQDFLNSIFLVLIIIVTGVIGIIVGGFISSKALKYNIYLGISVALTAIIAFPGDYILSTEVSRSLSKNDEENKKILDNILTPMLIGGFTTVTIGSVVISAILINFI